MTEPRAARAKQPLDTSHRLIAVIGAALVFSLSWAAVAARPWATPKPDPRLAALAAREQRLRADAVVVQRVAERRMAAYRVALAARNARIAAVKSQQAAAAAVAQAAPPPVRVVTLPPVAVTRTS